MARLFTRSATGALLLLAWGAASALGLGEATVSSDLSSPLRADIPITGLQADGIDPDALVLDVPGFDAHARLGFPEPIVPAGLAVALVEDGNGGARIRLTTRLAAREPVLRFLLRVTWPGGSLVRAYTLLLDPPAVARPSRTPAASEPVRAARASTPPARSTLTGNPFLQPAPARAGTRYGPVALGDTLYAIVASAYPQRATDEIARAIVARNPGAFAGGDPARLLLGAQLDLPAAAELSAGTAQAAASSPQPAAGTPAPGQTGAGPTGVGPTYVVRPGDTLYSIARGLPGVAEAQLPARVRALFERNPNAFAGGDMNRLMAGATLDLGADTAAAAGTGAPVRAAATQATPPPAADPVPATGSADAAQVQVELEQARASVARERSEHTMLLDRLAQAEREVEQLRARDAELTAATTQLQATLKEREAARASVVPAPVPVPAAAPASASAPAAAALAASTPAPARPAAPRAVVPPPPEDVALPDGVMLAAGAVILLLLAGLLLLALRGRRARLTPGAVSGHQADAPRAEQEQSARRRLAELRETHRNTADVAAAGTPPEPKPAPDNVRMTGTGRAAALAKEAAVHLAYGDHAAARTSIEEAIRLDPHRDEHKMILMTVYEATGQHDKARAIVDHLLSRRERLSGEIRAQVEQQARRLAER